MAYNYFPAALNIAAKKKQWDAAAAKGEDVTAIADGAKQYYDELRNAGRSDIADKLERTSGKDVDGYINSLASGYDPRKDMESISKQKYIWSEAAGSGNKDGAKAAENTAKAYYDSLRANGYGDIADKLKGLNSIDAGAYVRQFTPVQSGAPGVQSKYAVKAVNPSYSPDKAAQGIYKYKVDWADAKSRGGDTSQIEAGASKLYKELEDNGYGDVANHLSGIGASEAAEYIKRFTPQYEGTAEGNQRKSNDVYAVGKEYGSDIRGSYDKVYDSNINVNPVETGYGKSVMAAYGNAADAAYGKTLGGGTEDAGGNTDSYAAANANRQKAAILAKGNADILNYYNAISGRANEWAGGKAASLSQNLAQLQGNVDNDRAARQTDNQNDLQAYLGELSARTSAAQAAEETRQKEAELQNKLDVANVNADATKYKSDNDLKGTTYTSDNNLKGKTYAANKSYASTVYRTNNSKKKAADDDEAGLEFTRTTTQILNDAKERAKVSGYDANGNTVWTVDPDLYAQNIQALLDDPSYKLSERKALAQAYKESTGKTLSIKSDNDLIYSGIPDGIKRRAANQPSDYDLQNYVLDLLDAGTIDEKQAEALLDKHGALDDDIVD
jgi:hypothetical protein